MVANFEDIVDIEELEKEWEESQAKVVLERLVKGGGDKKKDGCNIRANLVYKMEGCFEHLKHFPQQFVTKKLANLRKGNKLLSPAEKELQSKWDNSRAKVVLGRLIEHGFDCNDDGKNKRADEVYKLREEFLPFPQRFFTQQLQIARKGKPKPPAWQKSRARSILKNIIVVGLDREDDGTELPLLTIYRMDKEFKRFPLKRFAINLEDLRDIVHEALDKALRDGLGVEDYLERNPPSRMDAPRVNYKRYPKWQESSAQKLLRDDLKILLREGWLFKGKDGFLPRDLYQHPQRPEYREFPLVVFRNHIYKEIVHDKQVNWNLHKKSHQEKALK
jgi:hypothetical protein